MRTRYQPQGTSHAGPFRALLVLAVIGVTALGWAGLSADRPEPDQALDPTLVAFATLIAANPSVDLPPTVALPESTPRPPQMPVSTQGSILYGARVGGHSRILANLPGQTWSVMLASGPWEDRDPALSPDGKHVAFASNRDGAWDLYLWDLEADRLRKLTDTPFYEGHPSWSPDGLWIAYEAIVDHDLDVWIMPVDGRQEPIQLTNHPGLDSSPAWDPTGRRIAFVSDRDGSADVFVADLNRGNDRLINLSRSPEIEEGYPAFSPDGTYLAYSGRSHGVDELFVFDLVGQPARSRRIGQGRGPAWWPDGRGLLATLPLPNSAHLVTYVLGRTNGDPLPGLSIEGNLQTLSWSAHRLPDAILAAGQDPATVPPLFVREIEASVSSPARMSLVRLTDVVAPHPMLSDAVDEAFQALRVRVAAEAGWDFLGTLEQAFVGLNDPLPPGFLYNDWLYTGRAFAFNQSVLQAGWVEVVREDFGDETFWRVYVRVLPQDGSRGEPMRSRSWDYRPRFSGNPFSYDRGGEKKPDIPEGYYLDFTRLAADYGFERVPAMPNWRTFLAGARFHEFVMREGLDWTSAMLELYPPSSIVTPTPFRTPTPTPTRTPWPTPTPWWWRWLTPSPTPTP